MNIPKKLRQKIESNNVILFVGAGMSVACGIPNWSNLVKQILTELDKELINSNSTSPINFKHYIEQKKINNIFDILDDLERHGYKQKVKKLIYELLKEHNSSKSDFHSTLWKISDKIITSNYDKILENSIPQEREITTFNNQNKFQQLNSIQGNDGFLYKIHGDIDDPDSCVFFNSDYQAIYDVSNANQKTLQTLFLSKTIIFVGFSLDDPFIAKQLEHLHKLYNEFESDHFIISTENRQMEMANINTIIVDDWEDSFVSLLNTLANIKDENEDNRPEPVVKESIDIDEVEDKEILNNIYLEKLEELRHANDAEQKAISKDLIKLRDRILQIEATQIQLDFQRNIPNLNEVEIEHLFESLFHSEKTTDAQLNLINKVRDINSGTYNWYHRSVIVSAIACSIVNSRKLDPKKIDLLIDFANDSENKVWQKAVTCLFLVLNNLGNKWLKYPALKVKLERLKTHGHIQSSLKTIIEIMQFELHSNTFLDKKVFENDHFKESPFNYFMPFFEGNPSINNLYEQDGLSDVDNIIEYLYSLPIPDSVKYLFCNSNLEVQKEEGTDKRNDENEGLVHLLSLHATLEPYLNYVNEFLNFYFHHPVHASVFNSKVSTVTVNNLKRHLLNTLEQHRVLARQYGMKEQWDQAVSHYEKVVDLDKADVNAWNNLAVCYQNLKKPREQIIQLRKKLLDLYPDNAYNINEIAILYSENKEFEKALEMIDKAIALNNKIPLFYSTKGDLFEEKKQYKDAVKYHSKSVEIDPSNYLFRFNLGYAKYNLSDYKGAITEFLVCVDKVKKKENPLHFIGLCYYNLHNYSEALEYTNRAIELRPKDGNYYASRSLILNEQREYDMAIYNAQKAIQLDPKSFYFYKTKVTVLAEAEKFEEALETLKQYKLQIDENNEEDLLVYKNALANVYRRIGRAEEAMNLINEVMEKSQDEHYYGTKAAIYSSLEDDKNFYKYCRLSFEHKADVHWFNHDIIDKYSGQEEFNSLLKEFDQTIKVQ